MKADKSAVDLVKTYDPRQLPYLAFDLTQTSALAAVCLVACQEGPGDAEKTLASPGGFEPPLSP